MICLFIFIGCVLVLLHLINIFGKDKMEKSERIQMALFISVCSFEFGLIVAAL